jgi:hypothetical protein
VLLILNPVSDCGNHCTQENWMVYPAYEKVDKDDISFEILTEI